MIGCEKKENTYVVNRNIKRIIEESGETQRTVAVRAGFGAEVFSNIIRCKRKVYADEVIPIAAALQVPIEELFQ